MNGPKEGWSHHKWGVEPGQIPSLESQAPAEPRPFKKVRAYLLLQFLGPFQKVNPKPGSSLSHSGPGPPSAQKVEKSWKTLIWCLPLFWVKWLKPIIHILLWWNFFELSCRMKSKEKISKMWFGFCLRCMYIISSSNYFLYLLHISTTHFPYLMFPLNIYFSICMHQFVLLKTAPKVRCSLTNWYMHT